MVVPPSPALHHDTFRIVDPTDSGRVVRGRIDAPRDGGRSLPIVILLHGFKGFMDWGFFPSFARRLAESGFVAIRYNTSGSGIGEDLESFTETEAFAHNTLSREIEDLERVREWIQEGNVPGADSDRTSLVGHSRGGGIALVHAAEARDCRCVVTWAAVSTFDRFGAEAHAIWRERGWLPILNSRTGQELRLDVSVLENMVQNRARFDVPAACRRLRIPVLVAHGTRDESVPSAEARVIAQSVGDEWARLLEIEGAGHTFGIQHPMTAPTETYEQLASATIQEISRHG
jgi:dienelactone hydrolase